MGVVRLDETKSELARYYIATLFNPTKATLIKAIANNHFTTWPELTQRLIRKHLPKRTETAQGHLDQEAKNIRSTKKKQTDTQCLSTQSQVQNNEDISPVQEKYI